MKQKQFLLLLIYTAISNSFLSAQKFKALHNNTSLNDFNIIGGSATYDIHNGTITGKTDLRSPNTFLSTKKEYANFELKLEVKVDPKLNSGIQIRSRKRKTSIGKIEAGRFHGPQIEIESKDGVSGYVYGESMKGGWRSQKRNPHSYFKIGKWNCYKIIAKGPRITTYINGHLIEDLIDKDCYKTHKKGHIGLQVHSISKKILEGKKHLSVQWKNLKIKEI